MKETNLLMNPSTETIQAFKELKELLKTKTYRNKDAIGKAIEHHSKLWIELISTEKFPQWNTGLSLVTLYYLNLHSDQLSKRDIQLNHVTHANILEMLNVAPDTLDQYMSDLEDNLRSGKMNHSVLRDLLVEKYHSFIAHKPTVEERKVMYQTIYANTPLIDGTALNPSIAFEKPISQYHN